MHSILSLQELAVSSVDAEQLDIELTSDISDHCSGWNPSGISNYCCSATEVE